MIRPATFLCALLAVGSGLYLYQSKHRAQLLDREIARTVKETATANERITILRTEYQLLNEPERLQALSQQYLPTRPMAPTQSVVLADLGARLPAPLPASAFAPPADDPAPALLVPIAAPPRTLARVPVQTAQLTAQAQVPAPIANPAPIAAAILAAAIPLPRPPIERPAPRRIVELPMPAPPRMSAPIVIGPAIAAPIAPAIPLMPRPALVQRVVATAPAPAVMAATTIAFPSAPPVFTSALGMATRGSLLPPPVPVH